MSLRTLITTVFSGSDGLDRFTAPNVLKTDKMFLRPKS